MVVLEEGILLLVGPYYLIEHGVDLVVKVFLIGVSLGEEVLVALGRGLLERLVVSDVVDDGVQFVLLDSLLFLLRVSLLTFGPLLFHLFRHVLVLQVVQGVDSEVRRASRGSRRGQGELG